jgi:hypothetical protein
MFILRSEPSPLKTGALHVLTDVCRSAAIWTVCGSRSRGVSWGTLLSCVLIKCPRAIGKRDCLASMVVVAGPGVVDVNGQQLDLRKTNSWLLKLGTLTDPSLIHTTQAVSKADASTAQRLTLTLLHYVTFVWGVVWCRGGRCQRGSGGAACEQPGAVRAEQQAGAVDGSDGCC